MATRKTRVSQSVSVPAPIGGWNARDPLANMAPTDAVTLTNVFPDTAYCSVRKGFIAASPTIGLTETLMEWAGPAGSHLIACASNTANTGFYRIESTATASLQATAMSNTRWQNTMFGSAGGNYLYVVNGEDKPRFYDGTTWTTSSLTNTASSTDFALGANLKHVMAHQQRLWFGENNSLNAWYLPVNQIHGAAVKFPLGSLARKGGRIVGLGSWTLDGGRGMDDQAVFVTSEGEVFIYQGTDPASASTWSLVGVYAIGRPIGNRCLIKVGGDLIVICEDGFYPLSKALIGGAVNPSVAISDKIRSAVISAAQSGAGDFGWEAVLYSKGKMLLFNIPIAERLTSEQYVMNTVTGAWTKFSNMDAATWCIHDGDLYYGDATGVFQADTDYADAGQAISTEILPAYNYFGSPGSMKLFKMARPVILADSRVTPALALCTDFGTRTPTSSPTYEPASGPTWDLATWDEEYWVGGGLVYARWQSTPGIGISAALRIVANTLDSSFSLVSIDYLYEEGNTAF